MLLICAVEYAFLFAESKKTPALKNDLMIESGADAVPAVSRACKIAGMLSVTTVESVIVTVSVVALIRPPALSDAR